MEHRLPKPPGNYAQLLSNKCAILRKTRWKDPPEPRAVHPPSMGQIVELPEVGGLHHRYERRAA